MKVALVYDRVNKFGGAERVMTSLHQIFPDAPIFTLVYDPSRATWADGLDIRPTFLNLPGIRTRHEWLAPISSLAFETHDLSEFDVIISITSSDAKSVITRPNQLHICYCLTPTRYFWSGREEYGQDIKMKLLPGFLHNHFRYTDLVGSSRPDEYISISREVQNRVKKYYGRDSEVIYPSIADKFFNSSPNRFEKENFFITTGRLVPYKKTELVIEVFNKLNLPLVVIGDGSELKRLQKMAGPGIVFTGAVDDDKLIEYYQKARALIFPQEEDFGLVPIEAQALGTPVIAYEKGGARETVINNITGLHFSKQTPKSLEDAVKKFEKMSFERTKLKENAGKFSFSNFASSFSAAVNRLWQKHQDRFR